LIILSAETWPQEASQGDQEARQQLVGRRIHRPRPTHRQEASEDRHGQDQSDALGTSIPLAELPATVNVITEDFLEDTRAYDIEDV